MFNNILLILIDKIKISVNILCIYKINVKSSMFVNTDD